MRLKSAIWVSAYLRRCMVEGANAVLRRKGAEEAGAIFIKVDRLDGTSDLFGPAPQTEFSADDAGDRKFMAALRNAPRPNDEVEAYLARQVRFDPDIWIVELEERAGRNFLDRIVGE
jgi:hypothetical protein